MAETRPSVPTVGGVIPATPVYFVDANGAPLFTLPGGGGGISAVAKALTDDPAFANGTEQLLRLFANGDLATRDVIVQGLIQALVDQGTATAPVSIANESGFVVVAGQQTPVRRAYIDVSSAGNNVIIPTLADPSKKITVLGAFFIAAVAQPYRFTGAGANLGPPLTTGQANDVIVIPFAPHGWIQTAAANQSLGITQTSAGAIGGVILYVEL